MHLSEIKTLVQNSSYLAAITWIAFFITLIGLPLAYYFYKKGSRVKRPSCITFSSSIASAMLVNVPHLVISYKSRPVKRLVLTKFVFWNAGSASLLGTDVPSKAPFGIQIQEDGEVLSCNVEFVKNAANDVRVSMLQEGGWINIEFDYFDKNEGFVLEILHTAPDGMGPVMSANFKGAESLVYRSAAPLLLPDPFRSLLTSELRSVVGICFITVLIFMLADAWLKFMPDWYPSARPTNIGDYVALVIVSMLFAAAGIYLWRTRLPKGFAVKW